MNSVLPGFMPHAEYRLSQADRIAITIDDAPSGGRLDEVLQFCADRSLQVTWFLRGDRVETYASQVRDIASVGHVIGSHGYRHVAPMFIGREQLCEDILKSLDIIDHVTGIRPELYRPPYGRINPAHARLPQELGCRMVLWNRMPDDWDAQVPLHTLQRRLRRVSGGDIVVLHEHVETGTRLFRSLEVLASVMEEKQLSSSFIPLSEGLS